MKQTGLKPFAASLFAVVVVALLILGLIHALGIKEAADIVPPIASWSTLGTVTNTYGVVPFLDSQVLTNARRFYRAQRLGP